MTRAIIKTLEDIQRYPDEESNKYFGILPDLDLDSDENIIAALKDSSIYQKHPYYEQRMNLSSVRELSEIDKFKNSYIFNQDINDCFYKFLYNCFIHHHLDNEMLLIEMITKTNLKYLPNNDQKIRRLEKKINDIFEKNDDEFLYYLNLFNEDYTQLIYQNYHKLWCVIGLSGFDKQHLGFSPWDYLRFKYFKGIYPDKSEVSSLERWQKLALVDTELKYYNELTKELVNLNKKDYFNSVSLIRNVEDLEREDKFFYYKIRKLFRNPNYAEPALNFLRSFPTREATFFQHFFRYFHDDNIQENRFTFLDSNTFKNVVRNSYEHLKDFEVGSNMLSVKMKNKFNELNNIFIKK